MSYTSSDPENFNRDPDTISLASASTSASQLSKSNKKTWSKFKSSIKTIGRKMSSGSKPNFTEPTESSERKKSKKSKKVKGISSASDAKPSSSEDKSREKSPPKGPKNLIKKLSVDTISTPFVGYQPSSVSPTRQYAKTASKSPGSTSESNLSFSDFDSPKKASTLDKSTKFSLPTLDSPDSGRVSQTMDDSRPPSQVTEEGYVSGTQRDTSDMSVDSDSTLGGRSTNQEVPFESLVAKTAQFAQSLIPPKVNDEKGTDVSSSFIKAETVVKSPELPTSTTKSEDISKADTKKENDKHSGTKVQETKKDEIEKASNSTKTDKTETGEKIKSGIDEVDGKKKTKQNVTTTKKAVNSDFIKSEQAKPTEDSTLEPEVNTPSKNKPKVAEKSKIIEEKPKTEPSIDLEEGKSERNVSTSKKLDEKHDKSEEKNKHEKVNKNSEVKLAGLSKNIPDKEETQKSPTSDNSVDKVSAPKPPSTVLDVVSPLDLLEPSAPMDPKATQMSVEEKLEAFLSAEGWSGTIKDITAKPSADGSQQPDKRECLYKILVIGELGTGKTSIIKRYVHQFFSQHYRATIGVDFALKVLNWDPTTIIRLQLWDIAGQERFGNMTRVYYKEAVGAFIVFDVTRSATFDAVLKWKQDLDSKVQLADGSPIPCVLLANKCDQQKEGIVNTPAKMDEFCKENSFSAWFETSAKENVNIDDAAKSLVTQILQNDKLSQNGRDSAKDGNFPLDSKSEEEGRSCAC